jgi:hypothetical protein
MRFFAVAVCSLFAAALIGCSQNQLTAVPVPNAAATGERVAPASALRDIYVPIFFFTSDNIVGFPKKGSGPNCYESTGANVNDVSTDRDGNLIVPNGTSLLIYEGPRMCGPLVGTIPSKSGIELTSAAALDARDGRIVVGEGRPSYGAVDACKLSTMRCTHLKSPNMAAPPTVAMDASGNCYADSFDTSNAVGLWYYAGCRGTGTELTGANGFSEPYQGNLSIDNEGHIVVLSLLNASFQMPSIVTVYSGCSTGTCTVFGGPFPLGAGESAFGHLDLPNKRWITTDVLTGEILIYAYGRHGKQLSFLYGVDYGPCASSECDSATYGKSSPK